MRLDVWESYDGALEPFPVEMLQREPVVDVARSLLGAILISGKGSERVVARILETEAYAGTGDRSCHAANGRRTPRNEVMYAEGGTAYVYVCYGIHHLMNIVTNREGVADAALIRGVAILEGLDIVAQRMKRTQKDLEAPKKRLQMTSGPGKVTKALGITMQHNRKPLVGIGASDVQLMRDEFVVDPSQIEASPRVGLNYKEAGDDIYFPWRFTPRGYLNPKHIG
jgi:DNA-3-methyladenine glycosylase